MKDSYKRLLLESLRDFIQKLRDKIKGKVDPGQEQRPGATPDPNAPKGQAHISNRPIKTAWTPEERRFKLSLNPRRRR